MKTPFFLSPAPGLSLSLHMGRYILNGYRFPYFILGKDHSPRPDRLRGRFTASTGSVRPFRVRPSDSPGFQPILASIPKPLFAGPMDSASPPTRPSTETVDRDLNGSWFGFERAPTSAPVCQEAPREAPVKWCARCVIEHSASGGGGSCVTV